MKEQANQPAQGIEQFMNRTEQLISKHGDTVVEAAMNAIQWHGLTDLIYGFIAVICAIGCFVWVRKNPKEPNEDATGNAMLVVVGLVATLISCIFLLNVWNWIAVFDPQTYFAHSLMKGYL